MKYLPAILLLGLAIVAAGCGNSNSSTNSTNASGTWSQAITSSTGQQEGTFTFSLTQNGTSMSGMNMNFSNTPTLSQCFGAGTTMTGQMNMQMGMGGSMTGTMTGSPDGGSVNKTLVMQGAMGPGMNSATGTFTLTGNTTGCTSQTGTFTMTRTGA